MVFRWLARLIMPPPRTEFDRKDGALLAEAKEKARALAKPAVALELQTDAPVRDDPHSSIGGAPSLPPGEAWPEEDGKPMLFLLQINYAEMPHIPGYPESGLLSVFVQDEDIYGCGFPSREQKGFRSTYYPDPTGFVRASPPEKIDMHPYGIKLAELGCPLVGVAKDGPLTGGCHQTHTIAKDLPEAEIDGLYEWLGARRPGDVYYGGHPDFVQYDIRSPDDTPTMSEVLLQQGYVMRQDRQWGICWGDAGEMALLISADDLENRRFEKAVYTWDCS